MNSGRNKYSSTGALKAVFSIFVLLLTGLNGYSQSAPNITFNPAIHDRLYHYHQYVNDVKETQLSGHRICFSVSPDPLLPYYQLKESNKKRSYLKLNYAQPNNQLMNWAADYPLTAEEIERRVKRREEEDKIGNQIAKDVITNMFKKKTKTAAIPKF